MLCLYVDRCREWMAFCNSDVIYGSGMLNLYMRYYVCSCHFRDEMYLSVGGKLCSDAVPELNGPRRCLANIAGVYGECSSSNVGK